MDLKLVGVDNCEAVPLLLAPLCQWVQAVRDQVATKFGQVSKAFPGQDTEELVPRFRSRFTRFSLLIWRALVKVQLGNALLAWVLRVMRVVRLFS